MSILQSVSSLFDIDAAAVLAAAGDAGRADALLNRGRADIVWWDENFLSAAGVDDGRLARIEAHIEAGYGRVAEWFDAVHDAYVDGFNGARVLAAV